MERTQKPDFDWGMRDLPAVQPLWEVAGGKGESGAETLPWNRGGCSAKSQVVSDGLHSHSLNFLVSHTVRSTSSDPTGAFATRR